jgi:hypothetical protein
MKKVIIAAMLLSSSSIFAQKESKIPANVKAAFAKQYPSVGKVKWEKEKSKFEASFETGGKHMSLLYNPDASVAETETQIPVDQLPAAAKKYAESKGKIKEAAIIVRADGSQVYEAEVHGKDLIFDKDGNLTK